MEVPHGGRRWRRERDVAIIEEREWVTRERLANPSRRPPIARLL